ncbi:hypothetical protein M231_04405 [Tremella mesenterica]|uniref:DH domain-containing protein n=1 Tax=Tremella mesenterica TaxID=5217 RepID=A0A4Q1BKR3_TREME|nr:hypothetical protein M231_04405 [Tremella mesenterica]
MTEHGGDIANLEWHELVNPLLVQSLEQKEVRRQGLWWELVRGEREYVKDLHTISEVFIQPLRTADQLLFSSKEKLDAFIAEVFSSVQAIQMAHIRLLDRLMERQRAEWPLITSVSDLLLDSFLTSAELYEQYMKNYPFAESRVKREVLTNPGFQQFLKERNNMELTRRRDLVIFLSRPLTRLPRILLLLEAILKVTPVDHPDKEAIPTVVAVLIRVVRSSQPGIESAESKIKLWNVAERLLNKKGEIVDLELGDPKRSLVHSAYVFRRVRSETNWHLWQDLHAFLLDNYLLLTRDEENGKYVIVSRPIPLDILELVSADGAPERRYDFITQYRRRSGGEQLPAIGPERLMYPFTISTGAHGRTYTLCTATEAAREEWKAMIENTKRLRQFDLESNRIFAVHILHLPSIVRDPITTAETFTWLDRETLAVASASSVWIGWRRDPVSYQEMIRFATGTITTLTIIPDFPWLLVLRAHALYAYNLADMLPTFSPSTWQMKGTIQGETISAPEHVVAFVRVGKMKGRTLIVYAVHSRNSHSTLLSFHEPLYQNDPHSPAFRHFSTLSVSGYASEILFFRVTITAVTEKGFVVVEPGNPNQNYLPHFPHDVAQDAPVVRLASHGTALGMYQVRKEEFLLVYDWGGCYVDKLGTVTRNGVILRWNVAASYCVYRDPYLIFFDDSTGRAEVRHEPTGRLCEVTEENGMKALRLARNDQAILALGSRGLIQLVEVSLGSLVLFKANMIDGSIVRHFHKI